ncbi:TIGR04211 family SH3 domain-containing protein [Ignatzschineria sp. RMDPL8A]|uniref:TIGR04211 family SH3 domain-containing protein n=1 Tax=Ignatzschineria sp. RMDPL8A TaxID=2999236 RepID=UPI0024467008|nr:TIGR04211 family SH3 domain-containing protein [Ignatzschineria sp. RMDPL8A]MDG9730420.1 TIGR04211 family SH3 domain-containing protein [Ignatzschineria sp. RMDPL8A]
MKRLISMITLAMVLVVGAEAKQLYVSDQLEAPVRAGSGDSFRIQKMLDSGTPVEEVSRRGQFVQIRYSGGVTGWMHQRFLMDEPVARDLVEKAREDLKAVETYKTKITEQESIIKTLESELAESKTAQEQLESRITEIMKTSESIFKIDEQNKVLTKENHQLDVDLKALQQKHDVLKQSIRSNEWTVGAIILFSGIIFGSMIMPRLVAKLRRKRSWDL